MTTNTQTLNRPTFIRNVLLANITFCLAFAVLFTFMPTMIANFADAAWQPYYRALGIGLFAFGGFVFYTRRALNPRLVWIVFALDTAWVVGSYVLLAFNLLPITTAAKWAFAGIADAVLLFAILEWWGMRR